MLLICPLRLEAVFDLKIGFCHIGDILLGIAPGKLKAVYVECRESPSVKPLTSKGLARTEGIDLCPFCQGKTWVCQPKVEMSGLRVHSKNSEPFAAIWDQIWPDPVLWKNVPPEFSLPYRTPNYPDQLIDWEEVIA